MRSYYISSLIILFFLYLLSRCANVMAPTGGPMDTIPPVLIQSTPENKSLNYKGKTIKLEYDEYLKVDNINKNLIITPILEQEFETKIRKYSVELIFEEPFEDSTTYTFNFQEAIQDITEGNISQDNVIAFSTGNYIDSIYINGKVNHLFTKKTFENFTVCLYDAYDTLDIFNSKPMYLTRTNEEGKYLIENIKNGFYRIYAYNDQNSNLICDIPKETFGYFPDVIDLNQNIDSLFLFPFYLDMRDLEIQREGPSGKYYEIKLNKNIVDYEAQAIDSTVDLYHNFGEDHKTIRFYRNIPFNDSIAFNFSAVDSIDQRIQDTLFLKFTETKRSPVELQYSLIPTGNSPITDQFTAEFKFNKPIQQILSDSIYFIYDSVTFQYLSSDSILDINRRRDEVSFSIDLFYSEYLQGLEEPDSSQEQSQSPEKELMMGGRRPSDQSAKISFHAGKGAFISVEDDTLKTIDVNYRKLIEEEFGIIRGSVISAHSSYSIQLVKEKSFDVVQEINRFTPASLNEPASYVFNHVEPGNYTIRVFVDEDKNGKWDPGNIFINDAPEKVYIYEEVLSVRANWELTEIDLEF